MIAMGCKSWREKLSDSKDLPRKEEITEKQSKRWGTGTIVIPSPMEVYELMSKVPAGRITTINEIRSALAKKHGATIGCPITTGIFACIAANAAEEERSEGKKEVMPYWRTLKQGGVINEKYPGGVGSLQKHLQEEGHRIVKRGKKYCVDDYKSVLTSF